MSSLVGRGATVGRILPRLLRCGVVRAQGHPLVKLRGPEIQRIDERRWLSASAVPEQLEEEEGVQREVKKEAKKAPESNAWQEILDRKLHKLDMDVRRTGRAGLYDLENALSQVEKGMKCTANQALLLLRCCGSVLVDLSPDDRTKLLSETLSTFRQVEGLTFDVSHYNAMLKVHLENGNNVAASDFLQEMEEAQIVPNRVTFQHLIGLYCQGGNITGATTVLEHMKEEGMAINEAVFLSLLTGHCLKLDHESVNSTLGVMAASGLILGPETYAVAAATYGQAGDWVKVEEMLKKAEEAEVVLDDGDYLHIMVGCAKGGLKQQALEHLVPKLPKKAGFFQEMRNTLPQLIHSGATEVALELYLSTPDTFVGGRGNNDRSEQGAFLSAAFVRSSCAPEEAIKVVEKMKEHGYTRAMEHLIENAVKHGDEQFCESLGSYLKEKDLHPQKNMTPRETYMFLRRTVQTVQTSYSGMPRVIARLQNFQTLGFSLPQGVLSNDIIPHMIDLEKELPSASVTKLARMFPGGKFSDLANGTLQYLFNEEKREECTAAVNYLLNGINARFVYPPVFSQSIVRSYLATGSMDHLVTCLWYLSRESLFARNKEAVFKALTCLPAVIHRFEIEQNVESQYKTILDALIKSKVGVPQEVGNQLVELEPGLKSLVEESIKVWEEGADYWTQEQEEKFLDERRQLHLRSAKSVPKQNQPEPGSLEFMEIGFNRSKSGELRKDLAAKLISAYSLNDQPDKALQTFNYAKEKAGFEMSAVEMDKVVNALIRAGRTEEALARVQATVGTDERVFNNTFIQVVLSLAEAGEHEKVIKVLGETTPGTFVKTSGSFQAMNIFYHYDRLGDDEKTSKIKEVLISSGWVEENDRRMQAQLINQLLEKGDLNAVVQECERSAREQKFIPNKMAVTKQLIEVENLELLQRVLDMSINLHGEELALYDLILSFLDLGRIPQAKKLIETPGLRYNQQKFEFMLKRFKQGQDLEALEALVRLTKNLHGCNRDFLYQELVTAFQDDMPRVEEAWLEIQEEGLAPSDQLKIKIANALEAGGREVPFEVPETYVKRETRTTQPKPKQNEEPAPPKKESSPEPAKTKKEKPQTQKTPPADKAETDRFMALIKSTKREDLASLREEIEASLQSGAIGGGMNFITMKLVEKDLAEGAKLAAVVQNSLSSNKKLFGQVVKRTSGAVMKQYGEKNDSAGIEAFFASLDADQQKASQTMKASAHRLRMLLHEEDAYVDLVANDPNASNVASWVLSPGQLARASPELVTKLDTLAKAENQSAAIALCKIALARNNQQMMDANWAHIKEDRPKKASIIFNKPELSDLKGVISSMDGREKKEFMIELISAQAGGNMSLAQLVELTEEAMKGTDLTLEELPNNALRSLAKSKAFKEQATKILQAQKEETLST